jgi:hypothetical protein
MYGTSLLSLAISTGLRAPGMACLCVNVSNEAPTSLCSIKIQESLRTVQIIEIPGIELHLNYQHTGI